MYAFGSIVLTRFPLPDLSGDKRRPALVVSRDNHGRADRALARHRPQGSFGGPLRQAATLDPAVIAGRLGDAPFDWLDAHRATFFGVFGFGAP